jgi:hypothetical protein
LGGHLTGNGDRLFQVKGGLLVRQAEQIQAPSINSLTGLGPAGAGLRHLLGQGNGLQKGVNRLTLTDPIGGRQVLLILELLPPASRLDLGLVGEGTSRADALRQGDRLGQSARRR